MLVALDVLSFGKEPLMKDILESAYLRCSDRSVIGVDGKGRIVWANPAAGRLFQVKPEDLIGHLLDSWILDCDNLPTSTLQSADTGPGKKEIPLGPSIRLAQRADGSAVTLAIRAIPLDDEAPPRISIPGIRTLMPRPASYSSFP